MKLKRAALFCILLLCFVNRHSSLEHPDQTLGDGNTIKEEAAELEQTGVQESVLSETPSLAAGPTSRVSSVTSEPSEQVVMPTVAPATPHYDTESSMSASRSVLSDVAPADVQMGGASGPVSTHSPNMLKSSLDSSPSVPAEPLPSPDPADTTETKTDKDSITAALKQADEESKPKEDEMPSFDEFKRQMLKEEEEKVKQQNIQNVTGTAPKPKVKKIKKRKQTNYASVDCGAKVLKVNPEASNTETILTENRDIYMLNPCSAKIWFVVELCDTAQVKSIDIANFELFSSTPESFRVFVSSRYPTREWTMLGTFQARDERDVQSFPLDEPIYAKYLKVEMLSHFGSEHYCPLSLLRVYGSSMMEELEDHETDGQDEGEVSEGDTEEDVIQILPPNPSVKEDELKKKNIFEKAADTMFDLVKKFVGNDETENATSENTDVKASSAETKQSIVTLIEREEGEEKVVIDEAKNLVKNSSTTASKPHKMAQQSDQKTIPGSLQQVSKSTSAALTPCERFVQLLGHSSFGCSMGIIFYCKRQSLPVIGESSKDKDVSSKVKQKVPIVRKLDGNEEEETPNEKRGKAKRSKNTRHFGKTKRKSRKRLFIRRLRKSVREAASNVKNTVKDEELHVTPQQNAEQRSASEAVSIEVLQSVASIVQPSMSKESLSQDSSTNSHKHSTPPASPISAVTTKPEGSTPSLVSSMSSNSQEVSTAEPAKEITLPLSKDVDNEKPSIEKSSEDPKTLEKEHSKSISDEPEGPSSSVSSQAEVLSQATALSEVSTSGVVQPSVHFVDEKKSEEVAVAASTPIQASACQSDCKAVNSIELIDQDSPDVDILEIKLTDGSGKEGTAQLRQPDKENSADDKPVLQQKAPEAVPNATPSVEPVESSTPVKQDKRPEEKKTNEKDREEVADPSAVSSDSSKMINSENEPPIVAPPVVSQEIETPASVCISDSLSSVDASLDMSSMNKAQQQASISMGVVPGLVPGMGNGQKESIFVRLSNRIKALEQNLTLSTLYMEQINQRYRKNLDELLKNFDKKVNLLSNATQKAEVVINNQKEQIVSLQAQLDNTNAIVLGMKQRMASLNKEVMERHIIGFFMEVILIVVLIMMFRRCERLRVPPDMVNRVPPILNGAGPPRYTHKDCFQGERKRDEENTREQLKPEIIKALSVPDGTEDRQKETLGAGECKKKKHKKRNKSLDVAPAQFAVTEDGAVPKSPPSIMTQTAGLLFSSARGILGSWAVQKPTASQSEPRICADSHTEVDSNRGGLIRTRSLDVVPENVVNKVPPCPPPPPPHPPQNSLARKTAVLPPQIYTSTKRSSGSYGHPTKKTSGQHRAFDFSGKYGKQVKVG